MRLVRWWRTSLCSCRGLWRTSLCSSALVLAGGAAPALQLDGTVAHPGMLRLENLKAAPVVSVDLTQQTGHGAAHHVWAGALLWPLVAKAGLQNVAGKHTEFRHTLLAYGADGYAVAVSVGEIDPALEGKQVIVAYQEDGRDLPALRLVVPGDRMGARSVHDLVRVEVR